jgi:hypothetical protein
VGDILEKILILNKKLNFREEVYGRK